MRRRKSHPPFDKRIVLWHCTGRMAGLMQILGTRSQLGDRPMPTATPVKRDGETIPTCLVKSKRRFWLYKEIVPPPTGLKDFNPLQE